VSIDLGSILRPSAPLGKAEEASGAMAGYCIVPGAGAFLPLERSRAKGMSVMLCFLFVCFLAPPAPIVPDGAGGFVEATKGRRERLL